jgi:hypothetical protein
LSAIQEFQVGESMLDLSTELTSSGSVNVVTKSGPNSYHGQSYYYFRNQVLNSNLPRASDPLYSANPISRSKFFQPIFMAQPAENIFAPDPAGSWQLMPLNWSPYWFPTEIWNAWPKLACGRP